MSDLDILIKNIEDITSGRIWKRKDIILKIYKVYFQILIQIAEAQTPDTGYARGLIVKVFAEKFGFNSAELSNLSNEFYYYWKERGYLQSPTDRSWTTASEGEDLQISFLGKDVILSIADEGVTNQQFNNRIAISHPRPDNNDYFGHHIDVVCDRVNVSSFGLVTQELNILADEIAKDIVKGLGV